MVRHVKTFGLGEDSSLGQFWIGARVAGHAHTFYWGIFPFLFLLGKASQPGEYRYIFFSLDFLGFPLVFNVLMDLKHCIFLPLYPLNGLL